jgi:hypothetical protein
MFTYYDILCKLVYIIYIHIYSLLHIYILINNMYIQVKVCMIYILYDNMYYITYYKTICIKSANTNN